MTGEHASPTRMALLTRRAQIRLAQEGATLLEGKRHALLQELLTRAREYRDLRRELHNRGRAATIALVLARAMRGTDELRSAAIALQRNIDAQVKTANVWGIPLADVECREIVRTQEDLGLGRLATSSHVWESAEAAERMLEILLACAPRERNLQLLGNEIRKVSRRINALQEHLIPKLREESVQIARALEEREREEMFRLKRVKKKKQKSLARPGTYDDRYSSDRSEGNMACY